MLIDGKTLKGRHGAAGELGHIPVIGSTIPCGCGNTGCMEAVAGGKALARIQKERFPETPIGDLFTCHKNEPEIKAVVDAMAVAAATEVNILDPDQLLIGGGVFNMKDFPKDYYAERVEARVRKPQPGKELAMLFTEDEADKSVVGGAIFARRMLGQRR